MQVTPSFSLSLLSFLFIPLSPPIPVGDLAMGHIAGLAFGGLQPHSPSEHVQDPNVLIIHSVKVREKTWCLTRSMPGCLLVPIQIFMLVTGSSLSLPTSPSPPHPPHLTLSTSPSPPHPLYLTLPPHAPHLTLSTSPSPPHHLTLSTSPSPPHPLHLILPTHPPPCPPPRPPFHLILPTSPFPPHPLHLRCET